MVLILLEALGALLLLVFIVWWTMFSGRRNGELPTDDAPKNHPPSQPATPVTRDPPDGKGGLH